jgi:hypothetical protein
MNSDVLFGQAVADERVLIFDIPDEVLERAATAEQISHWDSCGVLPVAR